MKTMKARARFLAIPVAIGAMLSVTAAECTPVMTADTVDHSFLNTFYGGAQMSPTTESDALTSCFSVGSVGGTKKGYICRNLYNSDFRRSDYLVEKTYVKVAVQVNGVGLGTNIVADGVPGLAQKGGPTSWFEGCTDRGTYYSCDYRSAWQAFYEVNGRGYAYGKLFRDWKSVVTSQALCASGVGAMWKVGAGSLGAAAWAGLINDCKTAPYKGGNPWRATP